MTLTEYVNQKVPVKLNYGEVIVEPTDERVHISKVVDTFYNVSIKLDSGYYDYFVEIKSTDKPFEKGLLKFYYPNTNDIGKSCFRLNMENL